MLIITNLVIVTWLDFWFQDNLIYKQPLRNGTHSLNGEKEMMLIILLILNSMK